MSRLKLRWTDAALAGDAALVSMLLTSVQNSISERTTIRAPGGDYVPFSYLGKSGYMVIKNDKVVTILGDEYCPEVSAILKG